jgi:catechol 2,3-dioxygenase-like lactoylglutathione lyase family enzyme
MSDDNPPPGPDAWRYPYGSTQRYHLQHVHLFASDIDRTIAFYRRWFDAEVTWDGVYAEARNVFMKIGIGAIHLYDQAPRGDGRNAVHHLGMQVVGLDELHDRMVAAGLVPNPIRRSGGSGYFMLQAPDGVLLELFEPGAHRQEAVRRYYGLDDPPASS